MNKNNFPIVDLLCAKTNEVISMKHCRNTSRIVVAGYPLPSCKMNDSANENNLTQQLYVSKCEEADSHLYWHKIKRGADKVAANFNTVLCLDDLKLEALTSTTVLPNEVKEAKVLDFCVGFNFSACVIEGMINKFF